MTDEQKAAYVMSQSVCALARLAGMQAMNEERKNRGQALAYGEDEFEAVSLEFAITGNDVVELFRS